MSNVWDRHTPISWGCHCDVSLLSLVLRARTYLLWRPSSTFFFPYVLVHPPAEAREEEKKANCDGSFETLTGRQGLRCPVRVAPAQGK